MKPSIRSISSAPCYRLATDVYEGLHRVGPDGLPEPGVASSWEWDFEAKSLLFKLRSDRFWTDGAPVVAQDFILSWKRSLMNPDRGKLLIGRLKKIRGAEACSEGNIERCASGSLDK